MSFLLNHWDQFISKCVLMLNLLRPPRIKPRLSNKAQSNRAFDTNKTLIAPPGTNVRLTIPPSEYRTFIHHGLKERYV